MKARRQNKIIMRFLPNLLQTGNLKLGKSVVSKVPHDKECEASNLKIHDDVFRG